MPRLPTLPLDDLPEAAALAERWEGLLGAVPNSLLTLAHRPEIMRAAAALAGVVLGPGTVPLETKMLVGHMASRAAGCAYCTAHTAKGTASAGVAEDKLRAVFDYETSPLFDPAERAALAVAQRAALTPNMVEDADFDALKAHYAAEQIVELVSVIALYGFLNRWNDTMATELEASPLRFAERTLAPAGWAAGKHAGRNEREVG